MANEMSGAPDKKQAITDDKSAVENRPNLKPVPNVTPLERKEKESIEAYEAFKLYCELAARKEGGANEVARQLKKSSSLIYRWHDRWEWKERYRLYQNQLEMLAEHEEAKLIKERSREWTKRRLDIREEGYSVGAKLIERGRMLLELPVHNKQVRAQVTAKSGEVIDTLTILNFVQHPRDAKGFIEAGIKLQRMSADMSTENVSLLDDNVDLDSMTEEQMIKYIDELAAMRKQQLEGND